MAFEPRLESVKSQLNSNARLPFRPLDKRVYDNKKYKTRFKDELVADYTPGEVSLYIINDNGELINVTASAEMVINKTIDRILKDQTILSNIKVETPTGNETLADVVSEITTYYKKSIESHNNIEETLKSVQQIIEGNKNTSDNNIKDLSDRVSDIEALVTSTDDDTLNGIQELIDYVNKHGPETTSIISDIASINKTIGDVDSISVEELKAGGTLVNFIRNTWNRNIALEEKMYTELFKYVKQDQIIVSTEAFDESKVGNSAILYIQVEN